MDVLRQFSSLAHQFPSQRDTALLLLQQLMQQRAVNPGKGIRTAQQVYPVDLKAVLPQLQAIVRGAPIPTVAPLPAAPAALSVPVPVPASAASTALPSSHTSQPAIAPPVASLQTTFDALEVDPALTASEANLTTSRRPSHAPLRDATSVFEASVRDACALALERYQGQEDLPSRLEVHLQTIHSVVTAVVSDLEKTIGTATTASPLPPSWSIDDDGTQPPLNSLPPVTIESPPRNARLEAGALNGPSNTASQSRLGDLNILDRSEDAEEPLNWSTPKSASRSAAREDAGGVLNSSTPNSARRSVSYEPPEHIPQSSPSLPVVQSQGPPSIRFEDAALADGYNPFRDPRKPRRPPPYDGENPFRDSRKPRAPFPLADDDDDDDDDHENPFRDPHKPSVPQTAAVDIQHGRKRKRA